MSTIDRVEIQAFAYEVPNLGLPAHGAAGVGNFVYQKGGRLQASAGRSGSRPPTARAANTSPTGSARPPPSPRPDAGAAPYRPRSRGARGDLRRPQARAARLRPHGPRPARHRALGPRRQALRRLGRELLGGFRKRLPAYASTYHGQDEPGGLDSPRPSRTSPRPAAAWASRASRSTAGTTATASARPRSCWACAPRGRRRHGADDRPGLRAPHLPRRAARRPGLRRGRLLLVRGPVSRRRRSPPMATSGCARS